MPSKDLTLEPGTTLIREVAVQYRGNRRSLPSPIRSGADVVRLVRKLVAGDAREHFITVLVNGRHHPIGYQVVAVGTATASLVHPREVFQAAVGAGAVAIVVAHNHPSGDPSPSAEDRSVTKRLVEAGNLLGIRVLDHVVVTPDGYFAFREHAEELFRGPDVDSNTAL